MYGNHPYAEAVKIAKQKTEETGREHEVFPSEDQPGSYTIGVCVKATTIDEILKRAQGKIK